MRITTTYNQVEAQILEEVKNSNVFPGHKYRPLSRVFTFIRAIANAIFLFIDKNLISLQKALHPHTAEEEDLHEWLKRYGLSWKVEKKAIHKIRIGSSEELFFPLEIPQGMIVSTDGPEHNRIKFQTLDNLIIPAGAPQDERGFYTIEALVECLNTGIIGNVIEDSIIIFEDSIDGLDIVYNPDAEPYEYGVERETIAQVRARLQTAENANINMFTPDWYVFIVEQHANVARAIFKTSREIGIPGVVKIFILGRAGSLSQPEMNEIKENLESDTNNPGGAARVLLENFSTVEINKTIRVQFPDLQSIPEQSVLDEVADRYFTAISEEEDVLDATLKALFLGIPFAVNVIIEPPGDVVVNEREVAIAGPSFNVVADVYEYGN
ncbi:MAG: baseplate J/gp47 family protein [Leptospiraceae bacterium]|nr:baseplate J/gp47 family protein [Leptospiraceae bacterium]